MDWIGSAAGVVTIVTGTITIVTAVKAKQKKTDSLSPDGAVTPKKNMPAKTPKVKVTPAVIEGVREFSGDDKAYQEWISQHPYGFVVNTNQGVNARYMALHKATCRHVSNFSGQQPGAFTERGYMKACTPDIGLLREWVKAHGRPDGSFTGNCPCNPAEGQRRSR